MDRDASLALLRDQHEFPGRYELRALTRPAQRTAVVTAIAAVEGVEIVEVGERASEHGRWVSVRVAIHAESAECVLDVYEVLRGVEGIALTL